jgi:Sec-independent protein translocase protein TatA
MKEQLAKLIKNLKKEMKDYQEAAQEMLDNAEVNNSLQDAEDYGVFVGKAEMLEDIIQKLESL